MKAVRKDLQKVASMADVMVGMLVASLADLKVGQKVALMAVVMVEWKAG